MRGREEMEEVEMLGGGEDRAVFIRGIDVECGFEGDSRPGLGNGGESLPGDNTALTCSASDGMGSKGGGNTGGVSLIGGDNGDEREKV